MYAYSFPPQVTSTTCFASQRHPNRTSFQLQVPRLHDQRTTDLGRPHCPGHKQGVQEYQSPAANVLVPSQEMRCCSFIMRIYFHHSIIVMLCGTVVHGSKHYVWSDSRTMFICLSSLLQSCTNSHHSTRSSTIGNFQLPQPTSEFSKKAFAFFGPKTWNCLPTEAKLSQSLDTFTTHACTYFCNMN